MKRAVIISMIAVVVLAGYGGVLASSFVSRGNTPAPVTVVALPPQHSTPHSQPHKSQPHLSPTTVTSPPTTTPIPSHQSSLTTKLAALHYLAPGQNDKTAIKNAVLAFQKWEGLPRVGVAGPQTQARLAIAKAPTPLLASGDSHRIEVSLSKQVALEVQNGQVQWVIPVSTGRPGLETPQGRFHIQSKLVNGWSAEYQEPLPYVSYFYNGYGIHGFASVPVHPASHGCVRVPLEDAPMVYHFDTIGTEIDVV